MDFDPQRLCALAIPVTVQDYGWHDAALYALGVGAGMAWDDPHRAVLLDEHRLRPLPTFATVLGWEGFWIEQQPTGIDSRQVLHAEQRVEVIAPLPRAARVERRTRVIGVVDRGAGRGAFVLVREEIADATSGALYVVLDSTILCRAEGGRGGTLDRAPPPRPCPDRTPDRTVAIATSVQQAEIYRLSGDLNPLHVDVGSARAAGFDRPILHGLATLGSACRVLVAQVCGGDPARVRSLGARFTSPVYPGEPLMLDLWHEAPGTIAFRLRGSERGVVVLDHGRFES